ncbi:MAG: methyltransferase domain-containing protein [Bryobacteraceae bacterium]
MNCDRIAPWYRWIEYAAFGRLLERAREYYLDGLGDRGRALVIGAGDGRFTARLAERFPALAIDSVDTSRGMVALAARRAPRVRFLVSDALRGLPSGPFDLVVTHFFLDCLDTEEVERLAGAVDAAPGARWIVTEFSIPPAGWRRARARFWIRVMYWFFGLATGLAVRRLPAYADALGRAGFALESRKTFSAGLVTAESWRLSASSRAGTLPSPSGRLGECP